MRLSSAFYVSAIRVTRAIYRLADEGSPGVCVNTESSNILDSRNLIPSKGELFNNEKSRLGSLGSVTRGRTGPVAF